MPAAMQDVEYEALLAEEDALVGEQDNDHLQRAKPRSRAAGGDGVGNGKAPGTPQLTGGGQQIKCMVVYALKSITESPITSFLTIYFLNKNISVERIGILQSVKPLVTIVGSPILTALAERAGHPKITFVVATLISSGGWFGVQYLDMFWAWLLVISAIFFVLSVTSPILDTTVIKSVSRRENYGKLRLGGCFGYGTGALLAGFVLDKFGTNALILLQAVSAVVEVSVAMTTKFGAAEEDSQEMVEHHRHQARRKRAPESFWHVFARFDVWIFIIWAVLAGASKGCTDTFLFYFLKNDLGGSGLLLGLSLLCTTVVEVPMFFCSGWVIDKIGHSALLSIGMILYCIRFVLCSFLENPWFVLPIELLHGLTFSITWSCLATYADYCAPSPQVRTTMQGIFAAAHWGVGIAAGTLGGGFAYGAFGGRVMFRYAAALLGGLSVIVMLFWWGCRKSCADRDEEERKQMVIN